MPEIRFLRDLEDFRVTVLEGRVPVLVAFSAAWCAPCAWLDPYLLELQEAGAGRLEIVKVDVDVLPELAERYRVASVPTVIRIRAGEETERSLGVEPARLRSMATDAPS